MLIVIPDVLSRDAALTLGQRLLAAEWIDGNATSGAAASQVKRNRQIAEHNPVAVAARKEVQQALARSPLFLSAALPARIYPPLFNRYGEGDGYGAHIDNAIRVDTTTGQQMRTDLSATLFLSDPDDYDGGELTIDGSFGKVGYKLPAGHMLLYSASSLHQVTPVVRGQRIASFFWIQSLVGDEAARDTLFELDQVVQTLAIERGGNDPQVMRLTRLYHNLVRRWSR